MDKEIISYNLGKFATVFQAETFRIERGAGRLLEMGSTGKDICILTEYQTCLKVLQNVKSW